MAYKAPVSSRDYELLDTGRDTTTPVPIRGVSRHALSTFLRHNPTILVSLTLGLCVNIACFAFTIWLARQVFDCPEWALYCSVSNSVAWFTARLALVQGVLATVYGISLGMVAYATYQLAETTLWPVLATRAFTMREIDHYLSATRGLYTSSPLALWHARGRHNITTVLIVTLTALLLKVDSVIVGHVYTRVPIITTHLSSHTAGGGAGFAFTQSNPPGMLPEAVGNANSVYNTWANGWSDEPMPAYRDFIVDRSNLTRIGSFAVHALRADKQIDCSASPINITKDVEGANQHFGVDTHMDMTVNLRLQGRLTLWVDNITKLDNNSAITRIIFAAINGSIEGGFSNLPTDTMMDLTYSGVSSLACDIRITIADNVLHVPGSDQNNVEPNATLTSLRIFEHSAPTLPWVDAVWLAAVLGTFGVAVYGFQPMFVPGPDLTNGTLALPVAFTTQASAGYKSNAWTQATLKNFIEVGSGALGMVMPRSWIVHNQTVVSSRSMQRLDPSRSYILLVPLGLLLGSIVLQACVCVWVHESTNLPVFRPGHTGELVASSQTNDIKAAFEQARKTGEPVALLESLKVRYGKVVEGYDGLAREDRLKLLPTQNDR